MADFDALLAEARQLPEAERLRLIAELGDADRSPGAAVGFASEIDAALGTGGIAGFHEPEPADATVASLRFI